MSVGLRWFAPVFALILVTVVAASVWPSVRSRLNGSGPNLPAVTEAARSRAAKLAPARRATLRRNFGKVPLSFEANKGQTDARVKFLSRGLGYSLFLTPTEAVLALRKPGNRTGVSDRERTRPRIAKANFDETVLRVALVGSTERPQVEASVNFQARPTTSLERIRRSG